MNTSKISVCKNIVEWNYTQFLFLQDWLVIYLISGFHMYTHAQKSRLNQFQNFSPFFFHLFLKCLPCHVSSIVCNGMMDMDNWTGVHTKVREQKTRSWKFNYRWTTDLKYVFKISKKLPFLCLHFMKITE